MNKAALPILNLSMGSFLNFIVSVFLITPSISSAEIKTDNDIGYLLNKMSRAFHELSYDGHFVYVGGDSVQSLRILHTVKSGEEYERLSQLNGASSEVIRIGHKVICLHKGDHLMRQNHAHSTEPFSRQFNEVHSRRDQFYRFFRSGSDRVAGREAIRVSVEPLDTYRYGYDLWLDKLSGLLLKSIMYNQDRKALETFEFIQLAIVDSLPEEMFIPDETTRVYSEHYSLNLSKTDSESNKTHQWSADWTPPGFYMTVLDIKKFSQSKEPVNTLMYSDGLAAFSVFIEKNDGSNKQLKHSNFDKIKLRQFGGTIAYSHQVNTPDDPYTVTVLGELPAESLKRVAESVKHAHK